MHSCVIPFNSSGEHVQSSRRSQKRLWMNHEWVREQVPWPAMHGKAGTQIAVSTAHMWPQRAEPVPGPNAPSTAPRAAFPRPVFKLRLGKEWADSEGTQQVPQPQRIRGSECSHKMRDPPTCPQFRTPAGAASRTSPCPETDCSGLLKAPQEAASLEAFALLPGDLMDLD